MAEMEWQATVVSRVRGRMTARREDSGADIGWDGNEMGDCEGEYL